MSHSNAKVIDLLTASDTSINWCTHTPVQLHFYASKMDQASTSRQELTSRQAVSHALTETATASHLVVKFTEGEEVSIVPMKRVIDPIPSDVKESSLCSVRWNDRRIYKATVLAMGKSNISHCKFECVCY